MISVTRDFPGEGTIYVPSLFRGSRCEPIENPSPLEIRTFIVDTFNLS
jgi:hypothetical protein